MISLKASEMAKITRTETTSTTLFTNEKETRRAIQAAIDKYNEIYSNHTVVKHQRSRHTKSKTQAPRKLRRNRERLG